MIQICDYIAVNNLYSWLHLHNEYIGEASEYRGQATQLSDWREWWSIQNDFSIDLLASTLNRPVICLLFQFTKPRLQSLRPPCLKHFLLIAFAYLSDQCRRLVAKMVLARVTQCCDLIKWFNYIIIIVPKFVLRLRLFQSAPLHSTHLARMKFIAAAVAMHCRIGHAYAVRPHIITTSCTAFSGHCVADRNCFRLWVTFCGRNTSAAAYVPNEV